MEITVYTTVIYFLGLSGDHLFGSYLTIFSLTWFKSLPKVTGTTHADWLVSGFAFLNSCRLIATLYHLAIGVQ